MVDFAKIVKKAKESEGHPVDVRPPLPARPVPLPARPVAPPARDTRPPEPPVVPLPAAPAPVSVTPSPVASFSEAATVVASAPISEPEPPAPSVPALTDQEARTIYDSLLHLARRIFSKDARHEAIDTRLVTGAITQVIGPMLAGDEKLLELATVHVLKDETSYLPQHAVNVCITSLAMGLGLHFDAARLTELGVAAFLHDIGMSAYEDMAHQPRALLKKEMDQVKNHVLAGDKILKKMSPALSETILTAQYEIHERVDGSGYPSGRRNIHEYAKIISLADTFESMVHPRPFRPRYAITEVYKKILEAKAKFDQAYIKVLVERLGFFPNGSYVQLNTKEVARVIGQNKRSPLRPLVRVLFAEDGRKLFDEESKDVNLTKYPTLHIVKCFLQEG